MLMNYHEMTMTEPRDSPERRKQFLVICTVMAAAFIHSFFSAGGLSPIVIEDGLFPGGDFVYKETQRDYAAHDSLQKEIAKENLGLKAKEYLDRMFTIFLDDTDKMSGRRLRFASGFLITQPEDQDKKDILLAKNEGKVPPSDDDLISLGAIELWPKLPYKAATLPNVKAATVQFSYTGGFVSSLIFSMRILPALRKYAKEHSSSPNAVTVISTCSEPDGICTHYAPLEQGEVFLMGKLDTEAYLAELGPDDIINMKGIMYGMDKGISKAKTWVGLGPKEEVPPVPKAEETKPAVVQEATKPEVKEPETSKEATKPEVVEPEAPVDEKVESVEAETPEPEVEEAEEPVEEETESVEEAEDEGPSDETEGEADAKDEL